MTDFFFYWRQTLALFDHPSSVTESAYMDRVQQISAELVQLYQAQLDIWEPGKLGNVNEADVLEYDQRRERIGELWKELEGMITTHEAGRKAAA